MNSVFLKIVRGDVREVVLKFEVIIELISCIALAIILMNHGREIHGWALFRFFAASVWTIGLVLWLHKYAGKFCQKTIKPKFIHADLT
jgi:hypothetical protein